MRLIQAFQEKGDRKYQKRAAEEAKESAGEQKRVEEENKEITQGYKRRGVIDRFISFGNNTIFWDDLACFIGIPNNDPGMFLNQEAIEVESGEQTYSLAYLVRVMVKLQNLGVIVCESKMTMGVSSPLNIDRFHMTFFGQKILSYIDDESNV